MTPKKKKSPELARLKARLEQWRKETGGGRSGAKIPEELWQEAVRVAAVEGVNITAQELRFSYMGLKKRMMAQGERPACASEGAQSAGPAQGGPETQQAQRGARDKSAAAPREAPHFVPVVMPPVLRSGGITVEVERGAGERLRVEVPRDYDVASLVQALWRNQG